MKLRITDARAAELAALDPVLLAAVRARGADAMSTCPSCGQQVDDPQSKRERLVAMVERQIKDAPSADPKEHPVTARDIALSLASLSLMSERLAVFRGYQAKTDTVKRIEEEPNYDYIEGLAAAVEAAKVHQKWLSEGNGGMSVPFHGDFANAPPSTLIRLEWWIRELRRERDKRLDEIAHLRDLLQKSAKEKNNANV